MTKYSCRNITGAYWLHKTGQAIAHLPLKPLNLYHYNQKLSWLVTQLHKDYVSFSQRYLRKSMAFGTGMHTSVGTRTVPSRDVPGRSQDGTGQDRTQRPCRSRGPVVPGPKKSKSPRTFFKGPRTSRPLFVGHRTEINQTELNYLILVRFLENYSSDLNYH